MRNLIFLPDREGRDVLTATTGFVRLGADSAALQDLADRLCVPDEAAVQTDAAAWRGMLAIALLCDVWPETDAKVEIMTVDSTTSLFAAWVLAARPASQRRDAVQMVLLNAAGQRKLLGLVDPEDGLTLPATRSDLTGMLPAWVRWLNRENGTITDPTPFLNQTERDVLLKRLRLMELKGTMARAFAADLEKGGDAETEAIRAGEEEALRRLNIRLQAVHGLKNLEAFTRREEPCAYTGKNALVGCFTESEITEKDVAPTCYTYLWDGVPFARTDRRIGLADVNDPGQEEAIDCMAAEIALLAAQSTGWNRRTGKALMNWLDASKAWMIPAAREHAEHLRSTLSEAGRQVQMSVTLTWPWDDSCGAVRYLLQEALGDGWMRGAANPFSDKLTKLTGYVLGDMALQTCCACADGVLLPPLSREMAACVAAAKDGEGLALDALRFTPQEDGGIIASFLLRGEGEVCLERRYALEDILVLEEAEAPTVAVWPCVPLERWHAYHVFARQGATRVEALRGGTWTACPETAPDWSCLHTETYPGCLVLSQEGLCLGALPNSLPLCRVDAGKEAVAAIDLGTATTSVVLALDGKVAPIREQQLTRLLSFPQEMPADDFLLSLTPRSVTPTAVDLMGPGEELFVDGHAYCPGSFDALLNKEAASIKSALKWRADDASVRARRLLLHQVMLGAALTAMMEGASSITWRVTVADEMDDEGRQVTLNAMEELASVLALETGLPLTLGKPAVTWAEEAAALCAYLRGEGGLRGSFVVLDMGSGSTKLHLWMHGQQRPAAGAVLLDGTQSLLLSALRARPDMLAYDFADCPDEGVQMAMQALEAQLTQTNASLAENDKAQLMLNVILDEYRQPISQHLYARAAAQRPAYMQAVLLENQAAAMFIAGLMLEQAGSDNLINHKLPEDMTICLTGRGAWLLDTLAPAQRNALQQIARQQMRLDNPVRFITLKAAPQPAMSVALGMAAAKETERTLNTPEIRTRASFSQLMQDLLMQFIQQYPQHAWLLHEGLFDVWGRMTPEGEDAVRRVASLCYGDGEDIPASVMAFVRRMREPITQAAVPFEQPMEEPQ